MIPNPNQWRKKNKKRQERNIKKKGGHISAPLQCSPSPRDGVTEAHSPGCERLTLPRGRDRAAQGQVTKLEATAMMSTGLAWE